MSENRVVVEGRSLRLTNLDKVLYPESRTTKAGVIDHYRRLAPVLLAQLRGRPVTRKRWPDGVEGQVFFEKNAPRGTPDWVRTVELPAPGSTRDRGTVHYPFAEELATLVWLGNLAALELHTPQWRVDDDGVPQHPDRMVIDLDPGPGTTVIECAQVALDVAELLAADGLTAHPSTSGSKGLQLYAGLDGTAASGAVNGYAKALAERCATEHPDRVVAQMKTSLRDGKVFLDWSQNNGAKTTITPYSLRGREQPRVATPVTWEEIQQAAGSRARTRLPLRFDTDDVVARVEELGDLLADVEDTAAALPS